MVMCGNLMVIRTDAILKLKNPYRLNEPMDLIALLNRDARPRQSATSLYTVLYPLLSPRLMCLQMQPSKSTEHFTKENMEHCPNSARSTLSMINMCIYKKWVNSKKRKWEQRTHMYSPRLQQANINRNAP